jgi:hypothetical protein
MNFMKFERFNDIDSFERNLIYLDILIYDYFEKYF